MPDLPMPPLQTQKTPSLAASGQGVTVAVPTNAPQNARDTAEPSKPVSPDNAGVSFKVNSNGHFAGSSPLHSAESFENYCSQVQTRLVEHAHRRAHFLQTAYDRLTRLLHTARSVEDTALYNELWQHRVAVRELMEALNQIANPSSAASPGATASASATSTASAASLPSDSPAPPSGVTPLNADAAGISAVGSSAARDTPPGLQNSGSPAANGAIPPASPAPLPSAKPTTPQEANGSSGHTARLEPAPEPTKGVSAGTVGTPGTNGQAASSGSSTSNIIPNITSNSTSNSTSGLSTSNHSIPGPAPQNYNESAVSAEAALADNAPRQLRHAVRPIVDIEADAARLRDSLVGWERRAPLRSAHSDNNSIEGLNVPNCLRLRAVACRMRRLEEEAGDTEIAEVNELARDIEDILDDAGDEEYTVALDYDIEPLPTAYQWGELAERYEETARAEEAFEWWITHRTMLSVSDVQNLAESVAAIQQRFNRLLFRIGARDPFQQQLFDDLRIWARDAQCYLYSLRPKVPIQELIEKAQTIDEAWEQARTPVKAVEERQQAIEDVVGMVAAPQFGEQEHADEQRLQTALLHCKELRIPLSDRRLRDALLPWATFLEGDERFKELLREINLEWERRQEAGKVEVVEEEPHGAMDELKQELEAVRLVTRGRRCLLLGGTCREENRRKIEEALQLSELVWPSTKPSDPLAKFDTELRHSDIVALLTRFSRKEWKNAQDICARDGKKFVHLTTGYGVAQVVRHFYTQIAPHGTTP